MTSNTSHLARKVSDWLDEETRVAVADFERRANWGDTFPRPIEAALPLALKAMVVPIHDLRAKKANEWLLARGRTGMVGDDDRRLHGCFLGWQGSGFIFVDAGDSPDERRFTAAHEVGHFLLDYLLPRQRTIDRFGTGIIDVMDGVRAATIAERFRAVLTQIPIGPCVDLMERKSGGQDALDLYASENRADRVALALLAPPELVLGEIADRTISLDQNSLASLLCAKFGLPVDIARDYSSTLLGKLVRQPSPYDRLVR